MEYISIAITRRVDMGIMAKKEYNTLYSDP